MRSKISIPFKLIDLDGDGFHPIVDIRINGIATVAIIDTGASKTAFDTKQLIKILGHDNFDSADKISAGLGTNTMECLQTTIEQLRIGDLLITNFNVAILDLSHINAAYEKMQLMPVIGVIGNDILVPYKFIIDYSQQLLFANNHTNNT